MRADEQCYPIEKSVDVEPTWHFSAFQISYLLRATNHEVMFEAAKDYRDTADSLDRTAEEIRRGAVDLAGAWRGDAAGDSLGHLRQYYASARSLAADCRASAAAMVHAASALGLARYRAAQVPGGPFPSTDPSSIESVKYQQVLADLNRAYREAITLAPNQLAVALPPRDRVEEDMWAEGARKEGPSDAPHPGGTAAPMPNMPARLPPVLPPNPPKPTTPPTIPRMDGRSQDDPRVRHDDLSNGDVPQEPLIHPPFESDDGQHTRLAGAGEVLGSSPPVPGSQNPNPVPRAAGAPSAYGGGGPIGGSADRTRPGGGVGGWMPGSGPHLDQSDRERRYYLNEEPDVWGEPESVPSILYGEFTPPEPDRDDGDDDL